jgi:hypothetical protein
MRHRIPWSIVRPLDIVALVFAALVIVAFSAFSLDQAGPGAIVEIQADTGRYLYSLDEEVELIVGGPIGESVIRIGDGHVYFQSAPCRDQICVAAGHLSEAGQWAACLPNRVFVTVLGEAQDEDAIDATAF